MHKSHVRNKYKYRYAWFIIVIPIKEIANDCTRSSIYGIQRQFLFLLGILFLPYCINFGLTYYKKSLLQCICPTELNKGNSFLGAHDATSWMVLSLSTGKTHVYIGVGMFTVNFFFQIKLHIYFSDLKFLSKHSTLISLSLRRVQLINLMKAIQ